MKRIKHKALSCMLAIAMITMMASTMPATTILAQAGTIDVKYQDVSVLNGEVSFANKTVAAIPIYSYQPLETLETGWYVVDTEFILATENRIKIKGDVNLILPDGSEFYTNGGIEVT